MTATLFALLVVIGFGLWMASAAQAPRTFEFGARLCFFIASILWGLETLA